MITCGIPIYYGLGSKTGPNLNDLLTMPITGMPEGVIRYRVRIRPKAIAVVYVQTKEGLTRWAVGPVNGKPELLFKMGTNGRWKRP